MRDAFVVNIDLPHSSIVQPKRRGRLLFSPLIIINSRTSNLLALPGQMESLNLCSCRCFGPCWVAPAALGGSMPARKVDSDSGRLQVETRASHVLALRLQANHIILCTRYLLPHPPFQRFSRLFLVYVDTCLTHRERFRLTGRPQTPVYLIPTFAPTSALAGIGEVDHTVLTMRIGLACRHRTRRLTNHSYVDVQLALLPLLANLTSARLSPAWAEHPCALKNLLRQLRARPRKKHILELSGIHISGSNRTLKSESAAFKETFGTPAETSVSHTRKRCMQCAS